MMSAKQQSTTLLNAIRTEILHEFAQRYDDLVLQAQQNAQHKQEYSSAGNEQKQLQQARQALYEHRHRIVSIWPAKLEQLSERALQTVYQDEREIAAAKNNSAGSKGGLSLLEFEEFEHSLRFDKLIQYMRNQAGQQLIDLNIRLAVMYGQDDIKERENPFRPYIFARSIAITLDQLHLPQSVEGITLSLLGEPAAQLLYGVYQLANAKLEQAGYPAKLHLKIAKAVQRAALQTVDGILPPGAHQNGFPGAPLPIPPAAQRASARSLSPPQQLSQLLHHLRGLPEPHSQASSAESAFPTLMDAQDEKPPGFGDFLRRMLAQAPANQAASNSATLAGEQAAIPTMPLAGLYSGLAQSSADQGGSAVQPATHDIVKTLGQMHKTLVPEVNAMVAENGAIRSLLLEQKKLLLTLTQDERQRQTIDIVALLFEVLLRDHLLSLDMRLQIGRLQFLYLQLALKEPAFLSQQHHPARQLLNRFCTVSHSASFMPELRDKIDEEINRIMRTLLRHDCEVPELFARLLARFETLVTREFRAASTSIRRTVKVIAESEMRSMRVANIREKLAAAFAHVRLDPSLKEFLSQHWSRAIEYAERNDKRMARCFRLLVPDIVWSCYPKHGAEQMMQLNAMLPTLLSHLKQGLQILNLNVASQQELLDHLARIHGQNLRRHQSVLPQQAPSILSVHEYFDSFTNQDDLFENNQIDVDDASEYWPEVANELGLPAHIIAHEWSQTSPSIIAQGAERELQEVLQCASLLRLKHQDHFIEASIHWINPSFANMVLALHGSNEAVLLTSIELHQLLIKNNAQLIEPELCFDRAILHVLQTADAMDALNAK